MMQAFTGARRARPRLPEGQGEDSPRRVLLVDPSLFTAPYDAALSTGLEAAGIEPRWAVRGLRAGEEDDLGAIRSRPIFYPLTDGRRRRAGGGWRLLKGAEHVVGMYRLLGLLRSARFDLVHFQWTVLPPVDLRALRRIRAFCPVVLTVHDTTPFNGKAVSRLQRDGFARVLDAADRLIVHTAGGREMLAAAGHDPARIAVIPHGLLARPGAGGATPAEGERRWRIVQLGRVQDYKGVDLLVEALGRLDADARARLSVVVAGEPMIDVAPLLARARALGLSRDLIEFRFRRQSQGEMGALLHQADAFVFPYRAIEASGVLFLVASARKWVVASDLGAFSEVVGRDGTAGCLVPPGDPSALAAALAASVGRRPSRDLVAGIPDWPTIGRMTRDTYREAATTWRASRAGRA